MTRREQRDEFELPALPSLDIDEQGRAVTEELLFDSLNEDELSEMERRLVFPGSSKKDVFRFPRRDRKDLLGNYESDARKTSDFTYAEQAARQRKMSTGNRERIVTADKAPAWMQIPWIESGYRVNYGFFGALKSLFQPHNELLNTWTHLLGLFVFWGLMIYTILFYLKRKEADDHSDQSWVPTFLFSLYLIGAQICMASSTIYHWFGCCSPQAYGWLLRVDYCGIAALVTVSFVPPIYYGFFCLPVWRDVYIGAIVTIGSLVVIMNLLPCLDGGGKLHGLRVALFVTMATSGVVPAVHGLVAFGPVQMVAVAWRVVVMYSLYGVGIVIYSLKIPERWRPGRFDIVGHSHQWWHLFVLAGAIVQLWVCMATYEKYLYHRSQIC